MKRTFKKAMSIILAFTLIFGSFAFGFSDVNFADFAVKAEAEDTATSGTCGENLIWTFDLETGELVISGTGDMDYYDPYPWYSYCLLIKTVKIYDGVTSIGRYMFEDCNNLTSITVDSTNTAFSNDEYGVLFNKDKTELIKYPIGNTRTSYKIPDSVINIGDEAFAHCTNLTNVIIGNNVKNLGRYTFYWCTSLETVIIGSDITSIDRKTFCGCGNLTSFTIPESVKYIAEEAFNVCCRMEYIHIPSSVTSIGVSFIMSDSEKSEYIENVKAVLESASEEELAEYAKLGMTKEMIGNCKPTTVICSDSENNCAKTYAEEYGHEFKVCDGNHNSNAPEEPATKPTEPTTEAPSTTKPVEIPTTIKPAETERSTTKPVEIPITTKPIEMTKPIATEPSTIKPVETTKPATEPTTNPIELSTTTKPAVTEPSTTKPVEVPTTTKPVVEPTKPATTEPTTKPEPIEEEIIRKPSTSTVKYGETLILHADFANIPEGAKIEWSVEGNGVTIVPSADGKTCAVTSTATGDVTITAKYVDANGVEHISEQEIKSNASFWQKIVSFFKNLFGMNRIIAQVIKF